MDDHEINARCAALCGVAAGDPFDAINSEDDLVKVITACPAGVDLAGLSAAAERDANGGDFHAAFRRAAAEAYAALQV